MMIQMNKEKEIAINRKYEFFLKDETEVIALYGGGGAGKSVAIAQKFIMRCLEEKPSDPHRFLVLRKVQKDLDDSVVQEIKDALYNLGLYQHFTFNKTRKTFTHIRSGNMILCRGLDEPERIKSIKGISSMWLEEATEFSQEEFEQLLIRIRGEKQFYVQWVLSFNPIQEDHWLHSYIQLNKRNPNFKFIWSTYKDNRFLSVRDKQRLEDLKNTNPLFYQIYCLGKWGVTDKSHKFLYCFDADKHIVAEIEFDRRLPLWLSFDFNVDPMTVVIGQRKSIRTMHILDEIRLNDSDIYQLLDQIKSKYSQYYWIVTGDASGTNRTGVVRGKLSYWQAIVHELRLRQAQIQKRSKNIGLLDSRVLCNAVLQTTEFAVHPRCENIIHDLKYAKVDESGMLVKDRDKNQNDFLDGVRYLIDANYPDILVRSRKYEKPVRR